ncbi:F0F1 ATP synthase subunit delta [Lactococcus termiticola]|uniref:ATP synthase subunit delta n=1 Tax=Lactococcus termiticola TaxID=2169526 RepID=A0A2R5HF24_9LACT|nr:F0F1 ATP synthase subunit delta [Lactococcus termiticola]GBG96677.1 F0F1 ATP synthase subunit delta [Lactococcus termiticola]
MTTVNAQKYGKALLEVAEEKGQLESILAEVNELSKAFEANDLHSFFANKVIADSQKSEVLETLKKGASPIMQNFLNTIRLNGRLASLQAILAEVKNSADVMFKISDVEVISSQALSDAQIQKMTELTKKKFDLNEVSIKNSVDESILGGFIINARGKIIDASIKTQLAKIASQIL